MVQTSPTTSLALDDRDVDRAAPLTRAADGVARPQRVLYLCRPLGVPDHDRCNALARRFASVTVVEWQENPSGYVWHITEAQQYRIRSFYGQTGRLKYLADALRMFAFILRTPAEIGIVYDYQIPIFFIAAVLLRLKGAHAFSMNDSKFDDYPRSVLKDVVKVPLLAPYHSVLAATRRAAEYVRYLGRKRVGLYYCAIDTERVRRLSRPAWTATPYDERPFISVARFVVKKNHRRLLSAFERYASMAPHPRRLILCGYGPLEADICKQIAESSVLTRLVDIQGFVSSDKIPALLGRCLALLLPSTEEQFGIVVTEAMAAGIPVMLSQECGVVDLVTEGEQGFIVRSDNEEQMARVMYLLGSDEARWRVLSARASAGAAQGDVAVFTDEVERLFDSRTGRAATGVTSRSAS
jgi:glycosyltransferase involved in cell wall biosynthesis